MEFSCDTCRTTFPELNVLESQLKCGICYDFMKTPMITSCAHSYCSICIRTWITTKPLCPTCQREVRDESLRNNLSLENCIDPYVSLQNKLHELCKSGALQNSKLNAKLTLLAEPKSFVPTQKESTYQTESKQTITVKHSPKPSLTPERNKGPAKQENEPQNVNSPAKIQGYFLPSPKLSNQPKPRTNIFTSPTSSSSSRVQNDSASSSAQSTNSIKVPCPICSVEIPERNINTHLDKCLLIQDSAPRSSVRTTEAPRRKPLQKLVYSVMSEKEIRKKLGSYNLSTKGDKSQLINRLQRFIILYNSECDSLHPRPVEEIRKQLEKDEEALTKVAPTTAKIFRVAKNADPKEIEEINKQYRDENKSAFNDLIRQIRKRNEEKKQAESSKDCANSNRTSNESASQTLVDLDSSISPATITSKRNRFSDDDSDDFSTVKRTAKTPKSRKIVDSDDDLFTPRSNENSPETPARLNNTNHKNTNGVLRQILPKPRQISSSDDEPEMLDDDQSPASPVFSRASPKIDAKTKRRPTRLAAQRPEKRIQREEEKDVERPVSRKRREIVAKADEKVRPNIRRGKVKPVRTVSRTPSLSPSRFQNLDGHDLDSSKTPELDFEMRKRPCRQDESDDDIGNDNLSQLVSLMNKSSDNSECSQEY